MPNRLAIGRRSVLLSGLGAMFPWAADAASERPAALQLPTRSAYVGINLSAIAYWTSGFPFADLMKNSGGWSSRDAQGGNTGTLALTPEGYPAALEPGQRAQIAVAWGDTRYASGQYVVLWEGDGEISFPLTAAKVASRAPGRIVLDVADTRGPLWVSIDKTSPAHPIRNLRFLWPGTEGTQPSQPFNPEFLAKLAPFRTLRFMDWGATNGSPIVRWADRALPSALSYSGPRGVPLEVMIELANTLQAEPWLCIPHRADDDHVRQFALLVQARLDPRLTATIEYSNEVWNKGFAQARFAVEQSAPLGLPTPAGMGSAFYAERVLRIVSIFDEVFGSAGRRRWRAVVCGQAAWKQFAADVLAWKDTARRVDALAIAPYFRAAGAADPAKVDASLALSSDPIIEQMRASVRDEVRPRVLEHAALARRYGLRLQAYEGGAHDLSFFFPAAKQDAMTALFTAAHRSSRMREVYRDYFETWIEAGGELMNQYNDVGKWSKWGYWSVLEHITQDPATAPKYQGLLDVIAAHPLPPR